MSQLNISDLITDFPINIPNRIKEVEQCNYMDVSDYSLFDREYPSIFNRQTPYEIGKNIGSFAINRMQAILFMMSSVNLMISSIAYSYVAMYSCLTDMDGLTYVNVGTFVGNILYILGYMVYIIGEYIQFKTSLASPNGLGGDGIYDTSATVENPNDTSAMISNDALLSSDINNYSGPEVRIKVDAVYEIPTRVESLNDSTNDELLHSDINNYLTSEEDPLLPFNSMDLIKPRKQMINHTSRLFRTSSIIFAISAALYTAMSIGTCYSSGWNQSNIGTLIGNTIYTIGCIVYACAEFVNANNVKEASFRTLLMTRSAMPILQHLE